MSSELSYKKAGVDIKKADEFVKSIRQLTRSTLNKNVISRPGSFGALFELSETNLKHPVMVSSTDGVGTKLLIAQAAGIHDTVGIDLVAMNVNDILCTGAKPLFFLDYIACGKLKPQTLKNVVKGIAEGCRQSSMSLIGGETAEMPGMYKAEEYDLAGFAVGVVDKKKIIDGSGIKCGDVLFGLPSSGIHSNGYSLVRSVFSPKEQVKWAKELLTPTRIYYKEISLLSGAFPLKGIAHITGGAYYDKLTKILPKGLCFKVQPGSWPVPIIFQNIQKRGRISDQEMYRTFNMGIGMAFVVSRVNKDPISEFLSKHKIKHYVIGEVVTHSRKRILI